MSEEAAVPMEYILTCQRCTTSAHCVHTAGDQPGRPLHLCFAHTYVSLSPHKLGIRSTFGPSLQCSGRELGHIRDCFLRPPPTLGCYASFALRLPRKRCSIHERAVEC